MRKESSSARKRTNNKDVLAIRLAKTALRDAYNQSDVEGVLAVFADGFGDMSSGRASFYGPEARAVLRHRLRRTFAAYRVQLVVTIISIRVQGQWAFDWGWHKLMLKPKNRGKSVTTRKRYLEIWQKQADGEWKIVIFFDNEDIPPEMPPKEVVRELRVQ